MSIKPIASAEGYFVSDEGSVFSTRRGGEMRELRAGGASDYAKVCLCVGGVMTSPVGVHRLVAKAFVPNPHDLPHVNHIDGNKRNNKATNLEWVTPVENFCHARNTGLFKGKLRDEDVRHIRQLKKEGVSHKGVAKLFGIDQSHVSLIASGKRYSWLA